MNKKYLSYNGVVLKLPSCDNTLSKNTAPP